MRAIKTKKEEHCPIGLPNPIEAIRFSMEQMKMDQKDLAEIIGLPNRVREILSKNRKLGLGLIRKLSTGLNIPAEGLVQEY